LRIRVSASQAQHAEAWVAGGSGSLALSGGVRQRSRLAMKRTTFECDGGRRSVALCASEASVSARAKLRHCEICKLGLYPCSGFRAATRRERTTDARTPCFD